MGRRILLADSDPKVQQAVREVAQKYGHEIILATTAAQVFTLAFESAPHLVVLDGKFPDADGRDVLARLKADSRTARLPVLVWSTRRDADSERRIALSLGAEDYVERTDAEALLVKIERVLLRFKK